VFFPRTSLYLKQRHQISENKEDFGGKQLTIGSLHQTNKLNIAYTVYRREPGKEMVKKSPAWARMNLKD
jgi:hypothetical protein